jgi:hypothetical protein
MRSLLHDQFHAYLVDHNPELILGLPPQRSLAAYINEKIAGIDDQLQHLLATEIAQDQIIERCMESLISELRPSRYLYLKEIMEEEFPGDHLVMREAGTLTYELVNLVTACSPIFKTLGFAEENQDNRILRYAVIGQTREYLSATQL